MLHAIITFGAWTFIVFCFGATLSSFDFGSGFPGWLALHDGLTTALVAAFGIVVAVQQIEAGRKQHRATIRASLRREFDAVASARFYATSMIGKADDTSDDLVSAIMESPRTRSFWNPPEHVSSDIEMHAGEIVATLFQYLVADIDAFLEWQSNGSREDADLFGGVINGFDERVAKIRLLCNHVIVACEKRRTDLEKLVTG